MLDVMDFVTERGGDPKAVRESQRRRHAPEEAVDEVIALYEDHRKSMISMYLYGRELMRTLQPTMPPRKSVTR
jgi:seryl-tRNA synthetase